MPLPIDPNTGLPFVPRVPSGWSIGPDGTPIPVTPGAVTAPGTMGTGGTSDLPLASMVVVGAAGYFLGKPRGQAGLWTAVGAALGAYFKPIG